MRRAPRKPPSLTPDMRDGAAKLCLERAASLVALGQAPAAVFELEAAISILKSPVKDPAYCDDPDAPPCGLCTCWKRARAAAS